MFPSFRFLGIDPHVERAVAHVGKAIEAVRCADAGVQADAEAVAMRFIREISGEIGQSALDAGEIFLVEAPLGCLFEIDCEAFGDDGAVSVELQFVDFGGLDGAGGHWVSPL
ncbi:protein of unknown function (plasmid) [Methylocella tundrae]|uniref:Uncharacterized protein n=1 Tax=Methylocella tundrae TaxID=227605 RepID=A0A4V6INA0_METTU|nr:protein of unknown function [Methylocella tundrae]